MSFISINLFWFLISISLNLFFSILCFSKSSFNTIIINKHKSNFVSSSHLFKNIFCDLKYSYILYLISISLLTLLILFWLLLFLLNKSSSIPIIYEKIKLGISSKFSQIFLIKINPVILKFFKVKLYNKSFK